jgi:hypothetical protein
MNNYCWANIKCPFFRTETEKSITCEGCQEGIVNVMRFSEVDQKKEYLKKNCNNFPNDCPVFKAAWENRL